MKRLFSTLSVLSFAIALAISVLAQSSPATGEWDVTMNTPGGPQNFKAVFKVEGEKLTGELKRAGGGRPIEGTAKGKEIQFSYMVKYQDNDLKITMSGAVDGDAIKGTVDFGGFAQDEWSAKRATGAAVASAPAPAATASSGGAIDVTGVWSVEVQTDAGSGSPSFTFKQDGEKLTGRYKGQLGESDLTGTVKGDKIEFSFKVSGQVEGTVVYTGTTDGKTMKGKVNLAGLGEGTFTGKKQ
ncbi:MAG: hypothetical protein ACREEM_23070 [Blastocatellia bacterium]